jgi:hypothetical protein
MVKRRGTLKGRGVGPSKVAPAEEVMEEEPVEVEETIDVTEEDALGDFQALVGKTGWVYEDGDVQGAFAGATKTITVVKVDDKPIRFILDDAAQTTIESGEDLTTAAAKTGEDTTGSSRRSRLKKQARRTQRKRRNRKGKQLRKLTTRRR